MLAQLAELRRIIAAHAEWLLAGKQNFALQPDEIEITEQNGKIIFTSLTPRGWQNRIVRAWHFDGEKLTLETVKKLNDDETRLELIPRESVKNLQTEIRAARLAAANELAEIARNTFSARARIERVSLNQSNQRGKIGTVARILLTLPNGETIAVCGSVVEKTDAENLLANAIFWFSRLEERRRISALWLVVETKAVENTIKLHALLRDGWREKIKIVHRRDAETQRAKEKEILEFIEPLSFSELWREKPKKINRPSAAELSETAQTIIALAPDAIDAARSKYGETLRFNGLPFVRIREVLGAEKVWFGVDARRVLGDATMAEFENLLDDLREHRQADAGDKRNSLFRAAPEAWLETVLRRDVSRLDPNLILAPVFAQFRLSHKSGALDLLAVRTDGRLVVIELKTTIDREHVFQAINYWRQVEQQRRAGNLDDLFGSDLKILDAPALVYLVAPLMSFHRDFEILAAAVAPEIEIWRFDLNEDWRAGVRVARRTRI